ncbi:Ger(x)C family spore germination protein [Salipaludibacillus daqingensis]|uniref:Ger(x)C family spore germination protein n=1 Tax=Salipaludibacillus daqingensis TaxID=3041001 RepID=UPI002474EA3D|nr:Ger(x)C family spore germination protein [Salipaludibacillus daqingensis]
MKRKLLSIVIVTFACLFITGCWDRHEIEEAAWVTALGFDFEEGEEPFHVHQTVALTKLLAAGDQTGDGEEEAFFVISDEAESVQKAVYGATEFLAREPKYGHVSNLIVGEELLREKGITPIISYAVRNHVIRPFVWISVGSPSALSVMDHPTGLEDIPSQAYLGLMDHAEESGVGFAVNLLEASKRFLNDKRDLVLPMMIYKDGQIHIEGLAVFHEDKMVDVLKEKDGRGLSWALERADGIISVLSKDEQMVTVNFRDVNSNITVETVEEDNLEINLEIEMTGDITDLHKQNARTILSLKKEDISEVTKDVEDEAKAIIENSLTKVQKAQSDVLGIAEMIEDDFPEKWEEMKDKWGEEYSALPISVEVNVDLKRSKRIK